MKREKPFFVSQEHHPLNSCLGIFVWLVFGILFYFTAIININVAGFLDIWSPDDRWGLGDEIFVHLRNVRGGNFTILVFAALSLGFFLLLISSSCLYANWCTRYKFCISVLYLLFCTATLGLVIYLFVVSEHRPLGVTIAFASVHLVLGILILPIPALGAAVFCPVVRLLFFLMRTMTCGRLEEKISVLERWDGNEDVERAEENKQQKR